MSGLASRRVAVIAATGDIVSARAALAATKTIPIVFTLNVTIPPSLLARANEVIE